MKRPTLPHGKIDLMWLPAIIHEIPPFAKMSLKSKFEGFFALF